MIEFKTRKIVKTRSQKVRTECLAKYPLCIRCYRDNNLQAHHVDPIHLGGADDLENCVTLCAGCHMEWHTVRDTGDSDLDLMFHIYFIHYTTPWGWDLTKEEFAKMKKRRLERYRKRILEQYSF